MPLKKYRRQAKKNQSKKASRARALTHQLFFPIVILIGIIWFLYRSLFNFPVWFDEIIGKAIFFFLFGFTLI